MININQNIIFNKKKTLVLYEASKTNLKKIISNYSKDFVILIINKKKGIFNHNFKNVVFFSWSIIDNQFKYRTSLSEKAINLTQKFLNKINKIEISLNNNKKSENLINNLFIKKTISLLYYDYLELEFIVNIVKKFTKSIKIYNFDNNINLIEKKERRLNKLSYKYFNQNNLKSFFVNNSFSLLFLPLHFFFIKRKSKFLNKYFKLGVRVYNNGIMPDKNDQCIDWMIKSGYLKKNDVLFIYEDELSSENKEKFAKMNYFFIEANNRALNYNLNFKKFIVILKLSILTFFKSFFEEKIIVKAKVKLLSYLFKWFLVQDDLKFKNYLAYNDLSSEQLIRNYFLKNRNIKTIHYKSTFTENLFDKNYKIKNINNFYAYYEIEHHWGKPSKQFSLNCKSLTSKFDISGPIWIKKKIKDKFKKDKIYSFFPTSIYGTYSVNSEYDHLMFLKFIKKLILKKNNYKFYYKFKGTKKKLELNKNKYFKELSHLSNSFKNFQIIFGDSRISNQELIMKSEIVFSMPFTSIILESIFCSKLTLILDSTYRFPKNFYNKYSIVFHDYEEFIHKFRKNKFNKGQNGKILKEFNLINKVEPQKKLISDIIGFK